MGRPMHLEWRALQQVPLLAGLASAPARCLVKAGRVVSLQAGDVLVQAGASSSALFVVLEGELEVEGLEATPMGRLKPFATIGEAGYVHQRPSTATVRARAPTRLLRLGYAEVAAACQDHPGLAADLLLRVATVLAERVEEACQVVRAQRSAWAGTVPPPAASPLAAPVPGMAGGAAGGGEHADACPPASGLPPASAAGPGAAPIALTGASTVTDPPPAAAGTPGPPGTQAPVPRAMPSSPGAAAAEEDAQAARLVDDFYRSISVEVSQEQRRLDQDAVLQLRREGFTHDDIAHTCRWLVRHLPAARSFSLVGLSIREAVSDTPKPAGEPLGTRRRGFSDR